MEKPSSENALHTYTQGLQISFFVFKNHLKDLFVISYLKNKKNYLNTVNDIKLNIISIKPNINKIFKIITLRCVFDRLKELLYECK